MFQGRFISVLALVGFLASAAWAAPEAVPGEYVVKLKKDFSTQSFASLKQSFGGEIKELISKESNAVLIRRPVVESQDFALQTLTTNPMVEVVEPNFIYRINRLPNDPMLENLWGLVNDGQNIVDSMGVAGVDVGAEQAWDIQTGSRDVVVAVIDTGVDYSLEDLAPNMWVNEAEKNGEAGVDDDGNGYVDDIYGYDFANKDGDPMDDHGHGSHVAGTIGANGDDGYGIVGVAWKVKMVGIKFLSGSGGGTLADAIKSIDYATSIGVDIMSNSWGGGGYSQTLADSIERARDAGILFVAAAGNSGSNNDSTPSYPATYDIDNIISVAAIGNRGELASFSCYGKKTVHIAAPGVNVLSNTPDGFKSWSGTSMATPHVSGVAALVLANEELNYTDLKERLLSTARPLSELRGKVATGGMVNAYYALTNTQAPADPNDPAHWESQEYSLSTPHPYPNSYSNTWKVQVEGAKRISVHFSRFETERGYDRVTFKDGNGQTLDVWSGGHDDNFSPIAEGDTLEITLTSDKSANKYGFDIGAVHYKAE